jgi:hypothetical protein
LLKFTTNGGATRGRKSKMITKNVTVMKLKENANKDQEHEEFVDKSLLFLKLRRKTGRRCKTINKNLILMK